jgi:predicted nucleic acid-binding protein
MSFSVLLDTNVLVPAGLNDLLLGLAHEGTLEPRWSAQILTELERYLVRSRVPEAVIEQRLETMRGQFADAPVQHYQALEATLSCSDPNDNHVLAAALIGKVAALVSFNAADFPSYVIEKFGLELTHPDDFLTAQFELNPEVMQRVLNDLISRWPENYSSIAKLADAWQDSLPNFSQLLRD